MQVLALDKRLFDPRRTPTPTPAEVEEGLVPLTDSIPISPQVPTLNSFEIMCLFVTIITWLWGGLSIDTVISAPFTIVPAANHLAALHQYGFITPVGINSSMDMKASYLYMYV